MPLLWKKEKIGQVSGFISDLRSRRRRSSLPVQTGFPTSLVDLIVKNRTRLKKPSSKKKAAGGDRSTTTVSASPSSPNSSFSEAPVLELPFKDGPRSEIGRKFCESELSYSCSEEPSHPASEEIAREFRESELSRPGSKELSHPVSKEFKDVGVSVPRCFSAIVKVFFVVILALGTKEIAVGITASAFILFFLEFVGKRLPFSSRPGAGGLDLNSGVRVCDKVDVIRVNESGSGSYDCVRRLTFTQDDGDLVEVENTGSGKVCQGNEIQVIESDLDLFKGERILEYPASEPKREVLAVGDDVNLIKVEKARNRKLGKAIFKKKFLKKFVPKKFRRQKSGKVSKEEKSDSSSEASEFKEVGVGDEDNKGEDPQEDEDEEVCSSEYSNEISLINVEDLDVTRKKMSRERDWNMGYLVFLVIILFGLVGGRVMALLLTVAWFLLVKSVGIAWRRTLRR